MRNTLIPLLLAFTFVPAARAAAPWPEFADYEHQGKCQGLLAAASDATVVAAWNQEKLDLLYGCSKAGPIPNGFMKGRVIFADGGSFDHFVEYASKLGVPIDKEKLKNFAESLWQGKQFYRDSKALLNKMGPDVKPLLGQDIKGQMRFPAKLFCGQSLLDGRRESIIIDYAFTDTVKVNGETPYDDNIDWIAGGKTKTGKRGLNIRDEIRMVKPGFYLGRAYMDRVFVLNFTLSSDTPADGDDKCWPGYNTGA